MRGVIWSFHHVPVLGYTRRRKVKSNLQKNIVLRNWLRLFRMHQPSSYVIPVSNCLCSLPRQLQHQNRSRADFMAARDIREWRKMSSPPWLRRTLPSADKINVATPSRLSPSCLQLPIFTSKTLSMPKSKSDPMPPPPAAMFPLADNVKLHYYTLSAYIIS